MVGRPAARRGVAAHRRGGDDANVAALFYSREQPLERYNMADTLKAQHIAHLTTGCVCYSDMGRILCSITADTCGWHDPLCGLTDAALIAARYGATRFQEQRNRRYVSGREAMLVELGKYGLGERDLVANINFFSKVVVDDAGAMQLAAGPLRRPGSTSTCASRWTRIVLLHAGPHPLATEHDIRAAGHPAAGASRRAAGRRRSLPHALPGERARLHQHREAVSVVSTDASIDERRARRASRGWASCAAASRLRIVDLEGNQAVDTLFYNAADTAEHYSAQNTIQAQGSIYLTTGTVLLSNRGNADAAHRGRHLRPARHAGRRLLGREQHRALRAREASHAQLPRQLPAGAGAPRAIGGLTKRDLPSNINFFMNVPVTPDGRAALRRRHLGRGPARASCAALMDTLVLISNCPQLNNPCNAYNPTPIRVMTWDTA